VFKVLTARQLQEFKAYREFKDFKAFKASKEKLGRKDLLGHRE
jgi:hypothetical protein